MPCLPMNGSLIHIFGSCVSSSLWLVGVRLGVNFSMSLVDNRCGNPFQDNSFAICSLNSSANKFSVLQISYARWIGDLMKAAHYNKGALMQGALERFVKIVISRLCKLNQGMITVSFHWHGWNVRRFSEHYRVSVCHQQKECKI